VRTEEGAAVKGDAKRLHGSTVEYLEGKRGRCRKETAERAARTVDKGASQKGWRLNDGEAQ
jgi:hypothetical protein